MFKLLVIDCDGVMTDGTKLYDNTGKCVAKAFCDLDFTAIKKFQRIMPVCFLSGDKNINENMAKERQVDFFYSDGYNKHIEIGSLSIHYEIPLKDIAYIGDDYYDIPTLKKVGYPFCPQNSPICVKSVASIIPQIGGHGVISVLYDTWMRSELIPIDIDISNKAFQNI